MGSVSLLIFSESFFYLWRKYAGGVTSLYCLKILFLTCTGPLCNLSLLAVLRSWIRRDPHHFGKLDPDLHQGEKQDPDLHQSEKVEALKGHFGALEGLNLEEGVIGSGSVYILQFFYLMIIYKKRFCFYTEPVCSVLWIRIRHYVYIFGSGSGSGSVHHQAKIVQTWISSAL